jgi:hypothetical protein
MDSEGEEIDADELEALKAEASADLVELKKEADEAAAAAGEGGADGAAALGADGKPKRVTREAAAAAEEAKMLKLLKKAEESAPAIPVGTRVVVGTNADGLQRGTIRFAAAPTDFKEGTWVGIELDEAKGKNDGTVKGRSYFGCAAKHGMFAKPEKVMREEEFDADSRKRKREDDDKDDGIMLSAEALRAKRKKNVTQDARERLKAEQRARQLSPRGTGGGAAGGGAAGGADADAVGAGAAAGVDALPKTRQKGVKALKIIGDDAVAAAVEEEVFIACSSETSKAYKKFLTGVYKWLNDKESGQKRCRQVRLGMISPRAVLDFVPSGR